MKTTSMKQQIAKLKAGIKELRERIESLERAGKVLGQIGERP